MTAFLFNLDQHMKRYIFLILPFFILASAHLAWAQATDAQGRSRVLVVMQAQADLSDLDHMPSKTAKGEMVYARLRLTADTTQTDVLHLLHQWQAPYQQFWIANAVQTWLTPEQMDVIRTMPAVKWVTHDHEGLRVAQYQEELAVSVPNTLEWGITKTKADQVWNLGYKGQNVVVAGADTGYQWDHPALKSRYRGWDGTNATHAYNWFDAIKQNSPLNTTGTNPCGLDLKAPCDDNKHGTHTMGTMVGLDGVNQIGMAPEAKWMACRNMERGWGAPSTYLGCLQFFLAPTDLDGANADPSKAPDVINNSYYCAPEEGCTTLADLEPMERTVNNLKQAGIVMVVSAGNEGTACNTIQYGPAIFENSFSVGSTDSADMASSFSSRGAVTVDGSNRMKPNVAAPGSSVRSAVYGSGYGTLSGTSMAGPHVAGLVALVISANPKLRGNVTGITTLIQQTATVLTSTQTCSGVSGSAVPNPIFGYGRIDALAAVNQAISTANEPDPEIPEDVVLTPAYPNPFNPQTRFTITVAKPQHVQVDVFDMLGRKIQTLWNGAMTAQETRVLLLSADGLSSGTYVIRAIGQNLMRSMQVTVAK